MCVLTRRAYVLLSLAGTVLLGAASRLHPVGLRLWDKSLGDGLYAVAAYLALALLIPRGRPRALAPASLGFCLAVEGFKLTGIPARHAHLAPVRWILGTGFSWHNVICYMLGVALIALVDTAVLPPPKPR